MIYIQLFISFFQIGLFSFGGGYAALPLIQEQVVTSHEWLSIGEFTDLITISQMTPGPIAINSATFVGIKIAGVGGALCATFGCIFPSCILVSILAYIYTKYQDMKLLKGALASLRPAVVALIASAGVSILAMAFFKNNMAVSNLQYDQIFIFLGAFLLLRWKKWNPVLVMLLAGVAKLVVMLVESIL